MHGPAQGAGVLATHAQPHSEARALAVGEYLHRQTHFAPREAPAERGIDGSALLQLGSPSPRPSAAVGVEHKAFRGVRHHSAALPVAARDHGDMTAEEPFSANGQTEVPASAPRPHFVGDQRAFPEVVRPSHAHDSTRGLLPARVVQTAVDLGV